MLVRQFGEIISDEDDRPTGRQPLGGGMHPYAEVLYVAAGQALLDWIGTSYHVHAPAAFLIAANTPHQLFRLSPLFRCWYIELELETTDAKLPLETFAKWNAAQAEGDGRRSFPPVIDYTLQSLYAGLHQQWHTKDASNGRAILALDLRKLFLLVEEAAGESKNQAAYAACVCDGRHQGRQASQEQIYQLIRYIEAQYAHEITLADLSAQSGLTPAYIIKLFKARIGLTPIQYMLQLRLNAAVSYLDTTALPVQEIAERCGFLGLHYFSRLFKQKFGISPSAWRQRAHTAESYASHSRSAS